MPDAPSLTTMRRVARATDKHRREASVEGVVGIVFGSVATSAGAFAHYSTALAISAAVVMLFISVWLVVRAPRWIQQMMWALAELPFRAVALLCVLVMIVPIGAVVYTSQPLHELNQMLSPDMDAPEGAVSVGNITAGDVIIGRTSVPASVGDLVRAQVVIRKEHVKAQLEGAFIVWKTENIGDSLIVVKVWLESRDAKKIWTWGDAIFHVNVKAGQGPTSLSGSDKGVMLYFVGGPQGRVETVLSAISTSGGRLPLATVSSVRGAAGEVVQFRWVVRAKNGSPTAPGS